jgi:selenium-binding protein 1
MTEVIFSLVSSTFQLLFFRNGSMLLQINVNHDNGGMNINKDFCVDFGAEPDGPVLAHEIRYPGGDCTSDIYLADTEKCCKATD